jgi:hypothetical protein
MAGHVDVVVVVLVVLVVLVLCIVVDEPLSNGLLLVGFGAVKS